VSKDELIALHNEELILKNEEINCLKDELSQLKKLIYGVKSERHIPALSPDQLSIFDKEETSQEEFPQNNEVITYTRSKNKKESHPGRNPLPEHLPVEEVIIEPEEDTQGLIKISEEVTDTIEYTPASLVIKRTIRPKYAKTEGQGVIIASLPDRPLPKAIAEASLLAYVLVCKFVEHMPFYRLIQKLERDYKWKLASSTVNDWFTQVCILLDPLYNKLKEKILDSNYIQVDESPIKVQDSDKKGKTHQGYQWVYHSPQDRLILFNYRKGRGMQGPKELLGDYQGILQCDGYTVYDKIGRTKGITLAGCLVHVRRKYVDAKQSDKGRANYALEIFKQIYGHELKAKESEDRKAYRETHILPLLKQLKEWINEESIKVLPKSLMGKAMRYTLNQWEKLMGIFTDGIVELDNNLIENKIRPLALGRKNYLFAGSHNGAQRIAMMYSFFATCKANDTNPYEWLKSTLEQIPNTSIQDLEALLPNNYNT